PIDCNAVLARHGRLNELEQHFVYDPFDVSIAPDLERERARRSAAFFDRAIVGAAGGMRFDFVRLSVKNVDASTIGLPSGNTGREPLVRIRDALVVVFLVFVSYDFG